MKIQRVTTNCNGVKCYLVYLDGVLKKSFSEAEHGCTAMAEANEYIEDLLIHTTAAGCVAEVRYS